MRARWLFTSVATAAATAITILISSARQRRLPRRVLASASARAVGVGSRETVSERWAAATAEGGVSASSCGACVLDPLLLPDIYCAMDQLTTDDEIELNATTSVSRLLALDPADDDEASIIDVLNALPGGPQGATIGILGDSLMNQLVDAMACALRRLGQPDRAGVLDWSYVMTKAGTLPEHTSPLRYRFAGPHGSNPSWFFLSQMFYNKGEVAKLLAVSDAVIINYGLHYCHPSRINADAACTARFAKYQDEMTELFGTLDQWVREGGRRKRVAIFQETTAQHFGDSDSKASPDEYTGDWERREFFPLIGYTPPAQCKCEPTGSKAVPMRTQYVRNLSARFPNVRLLRAHDLLAPRYGWHQQDCKANALRQTGVVKRGEPSKEVLGCDCTHYCYSPSWHGRYYRELVRLLSEDA